MASMSSRNHKALRALTDTQTPSQLTRPITIDKTIDSIVMPPAGYNKLLLQYESDSSGSGGSSISNSSCNNNDYDDYDDGDGDERRHKLEL